jgi:hypothetical protein
LFVPQSLFFLGVDLPVELSDELESLVDYNSCLVVLLPFNLDLGHVELRHHNFQLLFVLVLPLDLAVRLQRLGKVLLVPETFTETPSEERFFP